MVVTFCGHSTVYPLDHVRPWLRETVEALIMRGADKFYLGGYGAFDEMAASVVWEQKAKHPQITSVLVLPYLDKKVIASNYDCTTYPPLENVPKRFAISKRNEWMVANSDVVVAYVTHDWGGAATTLKFAKRKKKQIIRYEEVSSMGSYSEDRMKRDESVYLLRQLTELTQNGLLHWKCTDYTPIQLMSDTGEDEEMPYLAHNVCVQAEYGGRMYFAEIFESIQLHSGIGYIMMNLDYDDGNGRFDPDKDEKPKVLCLFSNADMAAFGDAVLPQIEGSAIVAERFADKDYRYDVDALPDCIISHPLVKLGQKLHNEQRLCDYHRAVVDEAYRRRMISRI